MIESEVIPPASHPDGATNLMAPLAAERPRLVRLCARITGSWDAAEDLAQETLLEAWRSREKLHDEQGLSAWLNAIARHVCLRWLREQARDLRHLHAELADEDTLVATNAETAFGAASTTTLERSELAELLERALALLPGETRSLLIETYVRERSQSAIAAQKNLAIGALRTRLHRGRLALQRVLQTELRADAIDAGIALPEAEMTSWQETRIWCPFCGRHRLEAAIDRASGEYSYRCAGNCQPGMTLVGGAQDDQLVNALANPKAILTRHCLAVYALYRQQLAEGEDSCATCGRRVAIRQWLPGVATTPPTPLFQFGVYADCPTCGPMGSASPWHLTLDTPSAMRFWRRHPRMRALPTREIEYEGREALVTGFESVQTASRLEIISARDTYEVLRAFGESGEAGEAGEVHA